MIPLAEVQPSCAQCAHWRRHDEPGSGDCLRWPPVVVADAESGPYSMFPCTDDADRCGEFKEAN